MLIEVMVKFRAGETQYQTVVEIPTSAPTCDKPFVFSVSELPSGDKVTTQDVLLVAIGDKAEGEGETNYVVAVRPPEEILTKAGISEYVNDLRVLVSGGDRVFYGNKFVKEAEVPIEAK
jgi:hypothetical protein